MPFLPAQGSLPGPFQWGGEHGPVPPASPQALPPTANWGAKTCSPQALARLPRQHLRLRMKPACPELSMLVALCFM